MKDSNGGERHKEERKGEAWRSGEVVEEEKGRRGKEERSWGDEEEGRSRRKRVIEERGKGEGCRRGGGKWGRR